MMYKLRFQKAGPYQWGDINVVVGDIHAIHTLYNALVTVLSPAVDPGVPDRVVAEVSRVNGPGEDSSPIYSWGAFKAPGEPVNKDTSGGD